MGKITKKKKQEEIHAFSIGIGIAWIAIGIIDLFIGGINLINITLILLGLIAIPLFWLLRQ